MNSPFNNHSSAAPQSHGQLVELAAKLSDREIYTADREKLITDLTSRRFQFKTIVQQITKSYVSDLDSHRDGMTVEGLLLTTDITVQVQFPAELNELISILQPGESVLVDGVLNRWMTGLDRLEFWSGSPHTEIPDAAAVDEPPAAVVAGTTLANNPPGEAPAGELAPPLPPASDKPAEPPSHLDNSNDGTPLTEHTVTAGSAHGAAPVESHQKPLTSDPGTPADSPAFTVAASAGDEIGETTPTETSGETPAATPSPAASTASGKAATIDPGQISVENILADPRGEKSGGNAARVRVADEHDAGGDITQPYSTETTSSSPSGCVPVGGSCLLVMFGCGCLLFGEILLLVTETNSISTSKSLKEGAGSVVSVSADSIEKEQKGKLVHVSSLTTTDKALVDKEFAISVLAVHLERKVEMYQWHETEQEVRQRSGQSSNRSGGDTYRTVYTYHKDWSSTLHNSLSFNQLTGHTNPNSFPFKQQKSTASEVKLGAFTLSEPLVNKIRPNETLTVNEKNIPKQYSARMKVAGEYLYLGESHTSPRVGDVRIKFRVATPTRITVVAGQTGSSSLAPYQTKGGKPIALLEKGDVEANKMFQHAQTRSSILTWMGRLFSAFVLFWGMVFNGIPIAIFGDRLTAVLGSKPSALGVLIGSVLLTTFLTLMTTGLCWVTYRPMFAGPLLCVGLGSAALLVARRLKVR